MMFYFSFFFPSCCSFSFDCAILWSNSKIELDGKIDGKLCSAETEMERIMSEELWSCFNAQFNSLINIGAQKCFNNFLSSRHDMRGGGRSSARLTASKVDHPQSKVFQPARLSHANLSQPTRVLTVSQEFNILDGFYIKYILSTEWNAASTFRRR